MQIFIQGSQLHLAEGSTEAELYQFIERVEETPVESLQLTLNGAPYTNFSDIQSEQTLHIGGKLFGGKVHGSLARAGKVKGQTPKVDKEEKKKAKTGRAKRRMQYDRRFVNVVPSFGKKKGPWT